MPSIVRLATVFSNIVIAAVGLTPVIKSVLKKVDKTTVVLISFDSRLESSIPYLIKFWF